MSTWSQVLVALILTVLATTHAAASLGIDIMLGGSSHNSLPIRIGSYHLSDPVWESRSFEGTPYHAWRIRFPNYEIEMIHDKRFLAHEVPGVEGFNGPHRHNHIFLNLPHTWGKVEFRLGLGLVFAPPEGRVEEDGTIVFYAAPERRVGGPSSQLSLGYRGDLWGGMSYLIEGKVTVSGIYKPDLDMPMTSRHLLFGIGYDL